VEGINLYTIGRENRVQGY